MSQFDLLTRIKMQPTTVVDKLLTVTTGVIMVLLLLLTVYFYVEAPQQVPISFDAKGNPRAWGSSSYYFFQLLLAITTVGICQLSVYYPKMVNLPIRLNPARKALQQTIMARMMRIVTLCVSITFFCLLFLIAAPQLNLSTRPFGLLLLITLAGVALTLICYIVRIWKAGR